MSCLLVLSEKSLRAFNSFSHFYFYDIVLNVGVAILHSFDHAVPIRELIRLTFAIEDREAVLEQLLLWLKSCRIKTLLNSLHVGLTTVSEVA